MLRTIHRGIRELACSVPVRFRVRGHCMAPLIDEAAEVEVAPAPVYLPGDIILFRSGAGRLKLHRLLGYRWHEHQWKLVTRGDAAPIHDDPVALDQVVGKFRRGKGAQGAARVPLSDRIKALAAFSRIVCRRLIRMASFGTSITRNRE